MAFKENFITSDGKNFITSDNKQLTVVQQLTGNVVLFPIENGVVDYGTKIYPRTTIENILGLSEVLPQSLTDTEIDILWNEGYTITTTITNGTYQGANKILFTNVLMLLTPNEGYILPSTITVTNADYIYDRYIGYILLSNPTGDVNVSIECVEEPVYSSLEFVIENDRLQTLRYSQSSANAVTVDWGDGSAPEAFSETAVVATHNYAGGHYTIKLTCAYGETWSLGQDGGYGISDLFGLTFALLSSKSYITGLSNHAFAGQRALTGVIIPNSITSIGTAAFATCKSLTSMSIPNSITSLSMQMVSGSGIENIVIPNSVTSIGMSAFDSCDNLKQINVPDSVTSILTNAFGLCSNLEAITIGTGILSIYDDVFRKCTHLMSITCKATTPPVLYGSTFEHVPSACKIYVPAESVEAYKSASGWSDRAAYIRAIPTL